MLDDSSGPVVVVAAQPALEALAADPPSMPAVSAARPVRLSSTVESSLEQVMDIVNSQPVHLLWQCGALTDEERRLTLDIAERAGIALCDSLSAPGFLPAYHEGRNVDAYLGVLGQYGTNREVYEFLQTGTEFNPLEEQWLFVLKGKLGQIDSPYSDSAHANRLRIAQVNKLAEHIAPFTDIGIPMPLVDFLSRVRDRLDVPVDIVARRRDKIRNVKCQEKGLLSRIPSLPMHPQYFIEQLAQIVRSLIENMDYRYAGMFDVGHCGTLGVSWLPRTDPSFSGWYGRGLMGDALLATAALATSGDRNVIAVIGDGAKHIVPDILPNLVENTASYGRPIEKNVTIFFLINNALSVINSYQGSCSSTEGDKC